MEKCPKSKADQRTVLTKRTKNIACKACNGL